MTCDPRRYRLTTQRLSQHDSCPTCGNYETPNLARDTDGGFEAEFVCSDCGAFWVNTFPFYAWTDSD